MNTNEHEFRRNLPTEANKANQEFRLEHNLRFLGRLLSDQSAETFVSIRVDWWLAIFVRFFDQPQVHTNYH